MDYYAILGVHSSAEDVVIRAAYKALAQRYHPDRFAGSQDEANRKMSEITKAYEVLSDPARRGKYDRRRLTYTQSVANYFNAGPRDSALIIDPRNRRSFAAMRRRSRLALSALMVAVVVLSVFNIVQYSAQLKDWLGLGSPSSAGLDTPPRATANAHATAVPAGAAPPQLPAAARNLPISQVSAPTAAPFATDAQTTAPVRAAPQDAATQSDAATEPSPPAATRQDATASASGTRAAKDELTPASAQRAAEIVRDEPRPAATALPVAASGKDGRGRAPRQPDGSAADTLAARAPVAPAPSASPPAAGNAPCSDAVAALGLCNPQTTARTR